MDLSAYKKKILIACSMIEDEINAAFDRFEIQDIADKFYFGYYSILVLLT